MDDDRHRDVLATRSASPSAACSPGTDEPLAATSPPGIATQSHDPQRYQVIGEHGRGGLGRVSRVHDRALGRDIAIKELISRGHVSEVRFLREALITARLEHPGIVPVHEAGRWPDGTPFYAMKLVAGRPLRDLIAERQTVDERIGLLHHVIAVADAIAYTHGRNIIHRDLKPSNVIVGDFGETVVIDWGLAKDLSTTEESTLGSGSFRANRDRDLTATGSVLGTPAYMAPEQERGEHVDQRADVFAIGAMLWELCALQKVPPTEPRLRHRILRRAGIDRDLITIIDKALDPDPGCRYPDAGALAADLKAFKAGARIAARSYSLLGLLAHWIRRHRTLALAAAAVIVLGAVQCRWSLQTRLAEQLAELSITQAAVEQGRQALLHDESEEAVRHLGLAWQRGDHSPAMAFMFSRALQPRRSELARFSATSGRMWSAVFSPDGRRIVTADDQRAQVWDAETHQRLFTLAHRDSVFRVVYSADGTRIVTASGDGTVKIWDARTGSTVRELAHQRQDGKPSRYYTVAVSPDGRVVAAIDADGESARIWDAHTGAALAELRNDGPGFPSLAFSADGRWLATTGGNHVRVFDTATWTQALTLDEPGARVRGLSFDPTGPRLATGTYEGGASIWAIPSGVQLRRLREIGEPIDAVAFSPDGALVVTASRDGAEQVWNAGSGKLQSQFNHLRGKIHWIEFDPSSRLVLAAGASGAIVVSDAGLGMPVTVLEGPPNVVREAHFDPSARRVVGASEDGTAGVWDATSPYRRWSSPPIADFCGLIASLEPDRRFLAVGCQGHRTRVWDTAHDQLLAELPSVTPVAGDFTSAFPTVSTAGDRAAIARGNTVEIYAVPGGRLVRTVTHPAAVNAVAFGPTGHDLVSGGIDGSLLVTRDDREPIALPVSPGGIDAATMLADGRVVAADARGRLRVYGPDRNVLLADLAAPTRVRSLRPSPDGHHLITVPSYKAKPAPAVLWDLEDYRPVAELAGHVGRVNAARFVRGGREILTTGGDGTVRLWAGSTGQPLRTYRGSSRFMVDATLDPDGWLLVGGGGDGLLRFWEASSGRPLWTLLAHNSHLIAIHFEGSEIVTRGFAGDVARWRLPNPESVIQARGLELANASGEPRTTISP